MKLSFNSPNSLSDNPRRVVADENMTSESLQCRMFRDESDVAMITRMKRAKRNIFKRVEIVNAWSTFALLLQIKITLDNVEGEKVI